MPKYLATYDDLQTFIRTRRKFEVSQFYYMYTNAPVEVAFGTDGAGPCVIIALRDQTGRGALGHLSGVWEPRQIVGSIEQMTDSLGATNLDLLYLAAANEFDDQRIFETVGLCGQKWRTLRVLDWARPGINNAFAGCMFWPLSGRIRFLDEAKLPATPIDDSDPNVVVKRFVPIAHVEPHEHYKRR